MHHNRKAEDYSQRKFFVCPSGQNWCLLMLDEPKHEYEETGNKGVHFDLETQ